MSLLENFRPRKKTDPLFGEVTFDPRRGLWEAKVPFAPTDRVERVLLRSGHEGPLEAQRRGFELLREGYVEHEPAIAAELFRLFTSFRENPLLPSPVDASELWALVRLEQITFWSGGGAELSYRLLPGLWDEVVLAVFVEEGHVRARPSGR